MTTIRLPPEIEGPLAEAARQRGTTAELLAIDSLRLMFVPATVQTEPTEAHTLFEYLAGYVGTVAGSSEALSEDCGKRFAGGMAEKQQRGHL